MYDIPVIFLYLKEFLLCSPEIISSYKVQGCPAVWIKVSLMTSSIIPMLASDGFVFHHSEETHAVLCKWLKSGVESKIPRFATHQVGVSGKYDVRKKLLLRFHNEIKADQF